MKRVLLLVLSLIMFNGFIQAETTQSGVDPNAPVPAPTVKPIAGDPNAVLLSSQPEGQSQAGEKKRDAASVDDDDSSVDAEQAPEESLVAKVSPSHAPSGADKAQAKAQKEATVTAIAAEMTRLLRADDVDSEALEGQAKALAKAKQSKDDLAALDALDRLCRTQVDKPVVDVAHLSPEQAGDLRFMAGLQRIAATKPEEMAAFATEVDAKFKETEVERRWVNAVLRFAVGDDGIIALNEFDNIGAGAHRESTDPAQQFVHALRMIRVLAGSACRPEARAALQASVEALEKCVTRQDAWQHIEQLCVQQEQLKKEFAKEHETLAPVPTNGTSQHAEWLVREAAVRKKYVEQMPVQEWLGGSRGWGSDGYETYLRMVLVDNPIQRTDGCEVGIITKLAIDAKRQAIAQRGKDARQDIAVRVALFDSIVGVPGTYQKFVQLGRQQLSDAYKKLGDALVLTAKNKGLLPVLGVAGDSKGNLKRGVTAVRATNQPRLKDVARTVSHQKHAALAASDQPAGADVTNHPGLSRGVKLLRTMFVGNTYGGLVGRISFYVTVLPLLIDLAVRRKKSIVYRFPHHCKNFWRWVKRHPVLVGSILTGLAALIVSGVIVYKHHIKGDTPCDGSSLFCKASQGLWFVGQGGLDMPLWEK